MESYIVWLAKFETKLQLGWIDDELSFKGKELNIEMYGGKYYYGLAKTQNFIKKIPAPTIYMDATILDRLREGAVILDGVKYKLFNESEEWEKEVHVHHVTLEEIKPPDGVVMLSQSELNDINEKIHAKIREETTKMSDYLVLQHSREKAWERDGYVAERERWRKKHLNLTAWALISSVLLGIGILILRLKSIL